MYVFGANFNIRADKWRVGIEIYISMKLQINCCKCQRSYHLRSYCIEKELQTNDTSLDFECSLCKINWVRK